MPRPRELSNLVTRRPEAVASRVQQARARGPTPSGFAYEIYKSHDLKIDLWFTRIDLYDLWFNLGFNTVKIQG